MTTRPRYVTAPVLAHKLGVSPRGALALLKAAKIMPSATVYGLGRFRTGFLVYSQDTADKLKRVTVDKNRKPSTASK